jgi:serine/threonine protein kinase
MIGYDGSVKVLDFGIAKAEERLVESASGTIKGKYGYMSPEQCRGKLIDRRSDVFSLGIVLYELTTLRKAFKGATDFQTMQRIVAGELERPGAVVPGYPPELEAIVHRALAVDPGSRFPTAQAFASALGEFAAHAKLSPSTTTLASYLVRLFGNKKEPWLEPLEAPVRPVEVVVVEPLGDVDQPSTTRARSRNPARDRRAGRPKRRSCRPTDLAVVAALTLATRRYRRGRAAARTVGSHDPGRGADRRIRIGHTRPSRR